MQIKFSKELMLKFGLIVLETFEKRSLNPRLLRYRLDWSKSTSVYLRDWISLQMLHASDEMKVIAESLKGVNDDVTVIKALKYVWCHTKYVRDIEKWKTKEKWQMAEETLGSGTGDCEDGSILLLVLCRLAGVSYKVIKINAGSVKGGGHCWVEYRSLSNGQSYFLDWCYWLDLNSIKHRKNSGELLNYYKVWWGFNDWENYKGYKL